MYVWGNVEIKETRVKRLRSKVVLHFASDESDKHWQKVYRDSRQCSGMVKTQSINERKLTSDSGVYSAWISRVGVIETAVNRRDVAAWYRCQSVTRHCVGGRTLSCWIWRRTILTSHINVFMWDISTDAVCFRAGLLVYIWKYFRFMNSRLIHTICINRTYN